MAKSKSKSTISSSKAKETAQSKRPYLKQTDVPSASLDDALRVPAAIIEHYASKPTSPLYVAKALNIDLKGSQLRLLTGAAIAFGLIEGGAQAAQISITDLAKKILKPKAEGEDVQARREAVLSPKIFKDFLNTYDGNAFPREDIALNVIEDMGVPRKKAGDVLARIESSANSVGFIEEVKGKKYVTLDGNDSYQPKTSVSQGGDDGENEDSEFSGFEQGGESDSGMVNNNHSTPVQQLPLKQLDELRRRKVFITHGKNKELVDPIKKLLEYGELNPVVSVDRQSVSKPVPEKVMDEMRMCGAAIIHVDADNIILDKDDKEHVLLNPNVLIEIGAAMAFYGRRFILLVKDGVKLPSNLQGLYEVRYTNDMLDAAATIKLLEAIKDIKNYSLPTEKESD